MTGSFTRSVADGALAAPRPGVGIRDRRLSAARIVGAALRSVSLRAAIPVVIDDHWRHRHSQEIELAVYFSCLEALQNAAKHAWPGVTATIHLTEQDGRVRFVVADNGVGFHPESVERGAGINNIADRVSAAGGVLAIDTAEGRGTRVSAVLPS
jgi:signal transduction histidine kinase